MDPHTLGISIQISRASHHTKKGKFSVKLLVFGLIFACLEGVDQFALLADASEKVPNLPKNRGYADFQLTKKDWDRLEVVRDVLRVGIYANSCHRH